MNMSKKNVIMENDNNNNTQIKNVWKLHQPGTAIQHQRQTPRQTYSKKNHGRMDSIRRTPWHSRVTLEHAWREDKKVYIIHLVFPSQFLIYQDFK